MEHPHALDAHSPEPSARAERMRRIDVVFESERAPAPPATPTHTAVAAARAAARRRALRRRGRAAPAARSVFGEDIIILARIGGPRLPITSAAGLARQLRRALMPFADQPVPELLSGHRLDGASSETPHLAVVPLPAVAGARRGGGIAGIALVLPRAIDATERSAVTTALARFEDRFRPDGATEPSPLPLLLGDAGILVLQRDSRIARDCPALQPASWIGPARRWASITPVALDRHPGDLHHTDPLRRRAARHAAARSVIEAVQRIGLPEPTDVDVRPSCAFVPGAAEPAAYPRFPIDARRPQRVLIHAQLAFDEPVAGPMLLGAGRYQGLGLCMPVAE